MGWRWVDFLSCESPGLKSVSGHSLGFSEPVLNSMEQLAFSFRE